MSKKKPRTLVRAKRKPAPPATPQTPSSPDQREETFWNTPGAAARTLHFTGDSLLDEEVDLANVSTTSFCTPLAAQKFSKQIPFDPEEAEPQQEDVSEEEDEVDQALGDPDETIEPTVVLGKTAPLLEEHSPSESVQELEVVKAASSPSELAPFNAAPPHHRQKVKVTTELERIVVRFVHLLCNRQPTQRYTGEDMGHCWRGYHAWPSLRRTGEEHEQEQASTCEGDDVCIYPLPDSVGLSFFQRIPPRALHSYSSSCFAVRIKFLVIFSALWSECRTDRATSAYCANAARASRRSVTGLAAQ